MKNTLARVFRADIQGEIIARLGMPRTQVFLAALLKHCEDTFEVVMTGCGDLDRMAHDLASTSGMLGFEDLSHRCRDLLLAPNTLIRAQALASLRTSLERAIAILRDQIGHVEAAA